MNYKELEVPAQYRITLASKGSVLLGAWRSKQGINVVITKDAGIIHLSVSHDQRSPTLREIYEAKYRFYEDLDMALYFPPIKQSKGADRFTWSLWEVKTVQDNQ